MAFFKNLFHPLVAQPTSHLTDGEIFLLLRQYQWGSAYVGGLPSYFFSIVDATEMRREFGRCDLRVGMHPELAYAGHIGYRVHTPYRGHHYALKASRLLLHFAYELGLRECIITCDPDNAPSRRTLMALGGELVRTVRVPSDSACYAAGDREKCQFFYHTADYFDPARHDARVEFVTGDDATFLRKNEI
ncbi:MAG: GNAT family N-acetyltransferase [Peptococcaceae bacterium]|nr:GNAT family N-acetyltransferase [Peptococcaceae bacterium]